MLSKNNIGSPYLLTDNCVRLQLILHFLLTFSFTKGTMSPLIYSFGIHQHMQVPLRMLSVISPRTSTFVGPTAVSTFPHSFTHKKKGKKIAASSKLFVCKDEGKK